MILIIIGILGIILLAASIIRKKWNQGYYIDADSYKEITGKEFKD